MATRRPFCKWHGWKPIGFGPWPQTPFIWNLKLKFQSKLELRSRNNTNCRVQILKNPIWLPGGHFESDIAEKSIGFFPYTQVVCQWSLNMIFKAKVKSQSGNRNIQNGQQAAILKVTSLKIHRVLPISTNNMHMRFENEILKQSWVMLRKPCRLQTDGQTDGQGDSS